MKNRTDFHRVPMVESISTATPPPEFSEPTVTAPVGIVFTTRHPDSGDLVNNNSEVETPPKKEHKE